MRGAATWSGGAVDDLHGIAIADLVQRAARTAIAVCLERLAGLCPDQPSAVLPAVAPAFGELPGAGQRIVGVNDGGRELQPTRLRNGCVAV